MKKLFETLQVLALLLALIITGWACEAQAFDGMQGYRFGNAAKTIASVDLTATEQAALKTAVTTYGPAVRSAQDTPGGQ